MKKIYGLVFIIGMECYGFSADELAVFNTPLPDKNAKKVKDCWLMCKKKLSRVELMKEAIDFYKKSPYHSSSSCLTKRSK